MHTRALRSKPNAESLHDVHPCKARCVLYTNYGWVSVAAKDGRDNVLKAYIIADMGGKE